MLKSSEPFFSITHGLIKGCVGDLMNNLIAAMNHPGSAENEYIMKGNSQLSIQWVNFFLDLSTCILITVSCADVFL